MSIRKMWEYMWENIFGISLKILNNRLHLDKFGRHPLRQTIILMTSHIFPNPAETLVFWHIDLA
jgi:hypothetical protein